ncbi:MAG: cob(I)yrinic acid a,c-diamide adenosyltransferase [Propionibacteriaceae bacterium]|nr:cob(I)yrinic acid a,c-diamide adenosyltransferase [Propionibacteriaceae bacterium]
MVKLTRIYTKTGDDGQTSLGDMSRTAKTDPRVEAYGAVDEANSFIGLALAQSDLDSEIAQVLAVIQNELFDLGADLSKPGDWSDPKSLRMERKAVTRLETWCDHFGKALPTLRSFVLPGGGQAAAALHCARAVTRRAEREAWRVGATPGAVNPHVLTYLNRLSDLLFILARAASSTDGEVLWIPGGDRQPAGLVG